MPVNRKLLGVAAFSLALAGGGVTGALIGTPALSSAQDEPSTEATETDPGSTGEVGGRRGPGAHRGERLTSAAEALGVTEDELRAALEGGQSLAQVAETKGVDVQSVIDALVADGTERLEEAIATLPDRVAELVEREGMPGRRGPGGHGGPPVERAANATAEDSADDAS